MSNALSLKAESVALCYDCRRPLATDSQYDVCPRCIAAEQDAYLAKQSCWATLPERQECRCGQHAVVR